MARLIDADALEEKGVEFTDTNIYVPIEAVWDAPTVDAAPVVHGYWINIPPYHAMNGNYNKAQECSVCRAFYVSSGNTPYSNHPYCAECGAKMDLKEEDHVKTD